MATPSDSKRLEVTLGKRTAGVVLRLGEVEITIKLPSPGELGTLNEDQARALILRHARRALEVGREELE